MIIQFQFLKPFNLYFMTLKLSLFFISFLGLACREVAKHHEKKQEPIVETQAKGKIGYDILHPNKNWVLPDELKEISGLTWVDKSHFVVIEDLHPLLYVLVTDSTSIIEKTIPFKQTDKEKFDIEDVTIKQDTVYALWSHGEIFRVSNWRTTPAITAFATSLTKEDNSEGICYDPLSNSLLIACKDQSGVEDEKKSTRAIYAFDLKTDSLRSDPFMFIYKKDFENVEGKKIDFYPSAIAVHPLTNDIYVLSTKENKCLAVFDHNGTMKSFTYLDKELMPQPEGICFAPDGKLYISTQGRHGKPAAIYQFNPVK